MSQLRKGSETDDDFVISLALQVYYERVNTHSATSHYYYEYCGVKDISKELILESKIPITKILLTKGFAFSNVRSATEFEEARSRFFAEQVTQKNTHART